MLKSRRNALILLLLVIVIASAFWLITNSSSTSAKIATSSSGTTDQHKIIMQSLIDEERVPSSSHQQHLRHDHTKKSQQQPSVIFISYADQKASSGMLYAAMLRQCYCRKFNYRLIIYNEYDLGPWSRKFVEERNNERNNSIPLSSMTTMNDNATNNNSTSAPRKVAYEDGTDSWFENKNVAPEDEAKYWSKLHLMKRTLLHETTSQRDWVVWVDADTVMTQPSVSFDDLLRNEMKRWKGASRKRMMLRRKETILHRIRQKYLQEVGNTKNKSNRNVKNLPPPLVTVRTLPNGVKNYCKVVTSLTHSFEVPLESFELPSPAHRNNDRNDDGGDGENDASGTMTMFLPDLLISNSVNLINNGIFAMRNTIWSHEFLEKWYEEDRKLNHMYFDNGPFMHAILREQVENQFLKYSGECSSQAIRRRRFEARKDAIFAQMRPVTRVQKEHVLRSFDWGYDDFAARHFASFQACYNYLLSTQIVKPSREDPFEVMTRCSLVDYLDNRSAVIETFLHDQRNSSSSNQNKKSKTLLLRSGFFQASPHPMNGFPPTHDPLQEQLKVESINAEKIFTFLRQVTKEFYSPVVARSPGFTTEEEAWAEKPTNKKKKNKNDDEKNNSSLNFNSIELAGYAWMYGLIRNDDPYIIGSCRMNNGPGLAFSPASNWRKEDSWTVHMAGWRNHSFRSFALYVSSLRTKKLFGNNCF